MQGQIKDEKKKDVRITIEPADNGGVVVKCCYCGPYNEDERMDDKTYVYDTLEKALKEIPSIMSVKQDLDEKDPIDKKMMKEDY